VICTSTPVRSSTYLSTGFNLPTLRSIGFGSSTCDFGRAHPVPYALRRCGLSVSLRLSSLRSLASPQIETPWPVIQNGRMDPVSTALRPLRSLGTTCGLSSVDFKLFSPPFRGTFQRSFALLLHYRSQDVFRIGRLYLPASRAISNARYQDPSNLASLGRLRDFHPLRSAVPGTFDCQSQQVRRSTTPHLPTLAGRGFGLSSAVFDRLYSRHLI
jgi:hypothetical protein